MAGLADGGQGSDARVTQSLVHTLERCWRSPSWIAHEVLWRWLYGIPALALIGIVGKRILAAHTNGTLDVAKLGLDRKLMNDPVGAAAADPMGMSAKVAEAVSIVLPDLLRAAIWIVPLLLAVWIVVSSFGRTLVLRRIDTRLQAKPGTLMILQTVRMITLLGSFGLWFGCLQWASNTAVRQPMAAGNEPNLVLYFALMIVATLGLFTAWAIASWGLAIAPLLSMLRGLGVVESLRAAFRVGSMKAKLVEINLVMGIIKIALIILAIVFSATPLPFESITSNEFLNWWWAGVGVLYFIGSDFFHVARLVAYLELWRLSERSTNNSLAQGKI